MQVITDGEASGQPRYEAAVVLGDLRRRGGRCLGFDGIQNPIGEQFHAVIDEEPGQA